METFKDLSAPCYNINQLRNDLWGYLKQELNEFIYNKEGDKEEHKNNVFNTLETLESIEHYYAFPSKTRVDEYKKALHRGEYKAVLSKISKIIMLMVNDAYRSIPHQVIEDSSVELLNNEEQLRSAIVVDRKYFEVLIVDDLSDHEKASLKERLRNLREQEDKFIYEINVQPSFQDVMIALLFNFNIQSVVIRYAPSYASSNINQDLEPFIQSILRFDYSKENKLELGPILARVFLFSGPISICTISPIPACPI